MCELASQLSVETHIFLVKSIHLLLTDFEVRTVSYGSRSFPLRFINRSREIRVSVIYSTDRNYLYCVSDVFRIDFYFQISDVLRKHNESILNIFFSTL